MRHFCKTNNDIDHINCDGHSTLLLAGHETSSTSLNWILYELAQHPEAQRKVREEIQALRAESDSASPNGDLSVGDLDNMPYTQAVIKASS